MTTLSMYQASAPRFIHMLGNLSKLLDKAQAHADAKKFDSAVLVQSRLAPDMLALAKQVQIACDTAKFACARLSGQTAPKNDDTETTLAQLQARIASTVDFVKTMTPALLDGTEEREITMKVGGNDVTFAGAQYLLGFVYPNLYFHITTAYALLRHNGVELGKRDFLGG